ncbi:hypothetical protein [Variovorax sp. UC74_104]|uniref:hypothetical protein n=1 Tax=Variovorax sp. UC74_104 TaxID=3374555 RepID=UPI003756A740
MSVVVVDEGAAGAGALVCVALVEFGADGPGELRGVRAGRCSDVDGDGVALYDDAAGGSAGRRGGERRAGVEVAGGAGNSAAMAGMATAAAPAMPSAAARSSGRVRSMPMAAPSTMFSPACMNTRDGLRMPSFSLNQPTVESAAPLMVSCTVPSMLVMPLTKPCIICAPKVVNLAGSSMPNHCMTPAKAW